jgi:hypothetical protein
MVEAMLRLGLSFNDSAVYCIKLVHFVFEEYGVMRFKAALRVML